MSYFKAYAEPSVPEQAALERPMDVPIVVPTPTGGRGGVTQGVN